MTPEYHAAEGSGRTAGCACSPAGRAGPDRGCHGGGGTTSEKDTATVKRILEAIDTPPRMAELRGAVSPERGPSGRPSIRGVLLGHPDRHQEIVRLAGDATGEIPGRNPEARGPVISGSAMEGSGSLVLGALGDARAVLRRARRRAARGLRRLKRYRGRGTSNGREGGGIRPENLVWIFGAARTGSTWLGSMMADLDGHDWWHEPMVGHLFGHLLNERAGRRRDDEHFILGGPRELWLYPVRAFVLDSAGKRFPALAKGGYLVIKEPHGSEGAPLLMEALPESRMILLVRDPRDVVASRMDLARKGSVSRQAMRRRGEEKKNLAADERPDEFVENQARRYLRHIEFVKLAYDAHQGPKAQLRYEDLRSDTLGEMKRLYSALRIPIDEQDLSRAVRRHSWENIPERKKGKGKFRRKAKPGGWTRDLTPQQIAAVEKITAPLLEEFYPDHRPTVAE
jgi:hypothetical protein